MDFEQEEVVEDGESPFLENRAECLSPTLIQSTAEAGGITCQRLFRTAYMRAGYPESFSRAIFALFAREQMVMGNAPTPLLIKNHCERMLRMSSAGTTRAQEEKCFGCSLTLTGLRGVIDSYKRIHPEVSMKTLILHATDPQTIRSSAYPTEVSEEEEIIQDMIDSGSLEEGNEGWQSMMQWDDTE